MASLSWEHPRDGLYKTTDGDFDAIVVQDGELWRSVVTFQGMEIDRGEWDGRHQALMNATGAIKRGKRVRSPTRSLRDEDEDDDE